MTKSNITNSLIYFLILKASEIPAPHLDKVLRHALVQVHSQNYVVLGLIEMVILVLKRVTREGTCKFYFRVS